MSNRNRRGFRAVRWRPGVDRRERGLHTLGRLRARLVRPISRRLVAGQSGRFGLPAGSITLGSGNAKTSGTFSLRDHLGPARTAKKRKRARLRPGRGHVLIHVFLKAHHRKRACPHRNGNSSRNDKRATKLTDPIPKTSFFSYKLRENGLGKPNLCDGDQPSMRCGHRPRRISLAQKRTQIKTTSRLSKPLSTVASKQRSHGSHAIAAPCLRAHQHDGRHGRTIG